MDRSWMQLDDKLCDQYLNGVNDFLEFEFRNPRIDGKIQCPCLQCNNTYFFCQDDVKFHLVRYGIVKNYVSWYYHGEEVLVEVEISDEDDDNNDNGDMRPMLEEAFGLPNVNIDMGHDSSNENEPNSSANFFYELLHDAEQPLFLGCTHVSKLSFLVKLLHLKCLSGWSNNSFNMLFEIIRSTFPVSETVPSSYYEARKFIQVLGLDYEKIDACLNDCILFRKEYVNYHECVKCGAPRWKSVAGKEDVTGKKVPTKILRYFPLTPRLQRLYMSSKTASNMRLHEDKRVKDGLLRHPADSEAWKKLDEHYPLFSIEPRNVRLGMESDGFNPFGSMSIAHSTWLVIVVPYSLPPWMCMKQPYLILTLLIPGPKAPGNHIDVYLQHLTEELKELWETGVQTYDASKKQNFQMHIAILWTINDFPAYANLSGYSTKGNEAKIAGPVQYRWMYPIERYLRTLKSYVCNKSCPEGSIAEGYLAEEYLNFCSRYLKGCETKFNRIERNADGDGVKTIGGLSVFTQTGRALGKATQCELGREEWSQARLYVLKNCDEIQSFIE
ncbi:uncharacterized protein LOC127799721 [Diospyros lotus]|uniref:uncharacterized protein LOC127799721 n=1 Tax=Diospyros lotus TaxID=55363 RepID=UPI00224F453B|nr:uncharacterized protein LOC127799721 [Diospyros lotus]